MSGPVLIAGAGIAGLAAAVGLARAGVRVTLVERRTGFSEVGAGLQLSPNATRALRALGLFEAVQREASSMRGLKVRRWSDGRDIGAMPMQAKAEADGAPFWTIRRADLQTALLDVARSLPGLTIMIGRKATGYADTADGVALTVESERGQRETLAGSALIAADGVWSQLRSQIDAQAMPEFLGFEAWRALVPARAAPPEAREPSVLLWLGKGRHVVHYPVQGDRTINLVVVRAGQDAAHDWDRAPDPAVQRGLPDQAAPALAALISAAPEWRRWSLFDRKGVRYAAGRVALTGDAAHPVLPFLAQGAALAIEDAALLARLLPPALGEGPEAVEQALAAYARARSPRAAQVQEAGRRNARAYHAGFPIDIARDLVLRRLGPDGMRARYGWLYGWTLG